MYINRFLFEFFFVCPFPPRLLGRIFGTATDRRLHSGRRQIILVRVFAHNQRQTGANKALAFVRRGFRFGRFHAAGSSENCVRGRRT